MQDINPSLTYNSLQLKKKGLQRILPGQNSLISKYVAISETPLNKHALQAIETLGTNTNWLLIEHLNINTLLNDEKILDLLVNGSIILTTQSDILTENSVAIMHGVAHISLTPESFPYIGLDAKKVVSQPRKGKSETKIQLKQLQESKSRDSRKSIRIRQCLDRLGLFNAVIASSDSEHIDSVSESLRNMQLPFDRKQSCLSIITNRGISDSTCNIINTFTDASTKDLTACEYTYDMMFDDLARDILKSQFKQIIHTGTSVDVSNRDPQADQTTNENLIYGFSLEGILHGHAVEKMLLPIIQQSFRDDENSLVTIGLIEHKYQSFLSSDRDRAFILNKQHDGSLSAHTCLYDIIKYF